MKRVAIVGLGAVGSWCSVNISKIKSIEELLLIDRDVVEEHNLRHQNYSEKDAGLAKASALCERIISAHKGLEKRNSISIEPLAIDLDSSTINQHMQDIDLIIDCTDNLETRLLINDFCMKNKIPWVYSGAIWNNGVVGLFYQEHSNKDKRIHSDSACFQCVFGTSFRTGKLETCTSAGLFNDVNKDVAWIAGALAKLVMGEKESALNNGSSREKTAFQSPLVSADNKANALSGQLAFLSADRKITSIVKTKQNPNCFACRGEYIFLNKSKRYTTEITEFCGSIFQIKPPNVKKSVVKKPTMINEKITVFPDGRALIKAKDKKEARAIYARYVGG